MKKWLPSTIINTDLICYAKHCYQCIMYYTLYFVYVYISDDFRSDLLTHGL